MLFMILLVFSFSEHSSAQENICNLSDNGGIVQVRFQDKIIKKYVHLCTQNESGIILSNLADKNKACATQFFKSNAGTALHGIKPGNKLLSSPLESKGLTQPPPEVAH